MAETNHRLILNNRTALELFGVNSVENFDAKEIVLSTTMGELVLYGEELHIERLDLDDQEMSVSGRIDSMIYRKSAADKKAGARGKSLMGRILK